MNGCRFETHVLRAMSENLWTDSLRQHVTTCNECAAAMAVGPWMLQFADGDDREHRLPDPAVLWLKAQLLQATATVDRAARPITSMQMAAYLIIAACWAALLTWKWTAIQVWMESLTPKHFMSGPVSASASASLSMTFFIGVILLASATVMVALHTILAEE